MEFRPSIFEIIAFLTGAECAEVFCCLGYKIAIKQENNPANLFDSNKNKNTLYLSSVYCTT